MNRFLLFGGQCYYATGGFHDFIGDFDTCEQAVENAKLLETLSHNDIDWWHVYDSQAKIIAANGDRAPYGTDDEAKPPMRRGWPRNG